MTRKVVRTVLLSNFADFSNGMATAWAFASFDAVRRLAWVDLLSSLFLAILSFSFSIGMKLTLYDKHT
jgi:hypothetical protein